MSTTQSQNKFDGSLGKDTLLKISSSAVAVIHNNNFLLSSVHIFISHDFVHIVHKMVQSNLWPFRNSLLMLPFPTMESIQTCVDRPIYVYRKYIFLIYLFIRFTLYTVLTGTPNSIYCRSRVGGNASDFAQSEFIVTFRPGSDQGLIHHFCTNALWYMLSASTQVLCVQNYFS